MNRLLFLLAFALTLHAVEVQATVVRVVDGDTVETSAGMVRLLWIDTPESRANSHGPAMPEGKAATEFLSALLAKDAKIALWGPGDELERDRYQRLLAVLFIPPPNPELSGPTRIVQEEIIRAGWSPLWEKYGKADVAWRPRLTGAQAEAQKANAGAWATILQWMTDKSNETTAPKAKK